MQTATSSQIQRIDRIAIQDFKIPSLKLMETAGRKSSRIIIKSLKPKDRVAIFCGKGNNGGDGLVVSRHLLKHNIKTSVFLIGKRTDLKPDASANYRRFIQAGGKVREVTDLGLLRNVKSALKDCNLIVDAIFGVGLKGKLSKFYISIIDLLNRTQKPIVAIDVPSGLDATTGRKLGNCITAYQTITFSLAKKGFFRNQGPACCGKIKVIDIGIPAALLKRVLKFKCR